MGHQLDQEAPTSQGEESLWPHPHLPHTSWCTARAGQSLGTERYKCSWAHLRLLVHLCTRPAHTLHQLLTQVKTLPLVAERSGMGGGSYVSPHLLLKSTHSSGVTSAKKEIYRQSGHPRDAICAASKCLSHRNGRGGAESTLGGSERRGPCQLQEPPLSSPSLSCLSGGRGDGGLPWQHNAGDKISKDLGGAGVPDSGRK